MAECPDLVATALNRLTDRVFTDALTDRDRSSLSDLVEQFFCSTADGSEADQDDSGKLQIIIIMMTMNIHIIIVCIGSNSGDSDGFGELEEELDLAYAGMSSSCRFSCQLLTVNFSSSRPKDCNRSWGRV